MIGFMVSVLVAGALSAQESVRAGQPAECPPLPLPLDHWASGAVGKLEAMGLLGGEVRVQRSLSACLFLRVLEAAAGVAEEPWVAGMVEGWRIRFDREYPGLQSFSGRQSPLTLAGASAGVVLSDRRDAGAPGGGDIFHPGRIGTIRLPDRTSVGLVGGAAVVVGERIGLKAVSVVEEGEFGMDELSVSAGLGSFSLSFGRAPAGYGVARSGGVVLGGATFDRVQLESRSPIGLGGVLDPLGSFGFNTFLARLNEDRHPGNPYFWGGSAVLQPHWRTTVSIFRAAMFGGAENPLPITPRYLRDMLLGRVVNESFEDQIVSVEGRFHLPTEALTPITVYLEWGAEDAAGAWWDVPGRVVGVYLPAIPIWPVLGIGVERSTFAESCCSNPMWYRHGAFRGGWAAGDEPLGHRLGGNGQEWMAFGRADLLSSGVVVEVDWVRRNRGPDNLFVPGREGRSSGNTLQLGWRTGAAEVAASASAERAEAWSERRISIGANYFF